MVQGMLKAVLVAGTLAFTAGSAAEAAPAGTPTTAPAPTKAGDALSFLHGEWVGTAKGTAPTGEPYAITQIERVGPMLGGDVTVLEGRGFAPGTSELVFNAFAVISRNAATQKWEIRSYASGYAGTFPIEPKPDGFVWFQPTGPDSRIRYTATVTGDRWEQIGEEQKGNAAPRKVFEMSLRRIGPTGWPMAGAPVPAVVSSAR